MRGAILIVGAEGAAGAETSSFPLAPDQSGSLSHSIACIELLGRSVLARLIEALKRSGFHSISVLGGSFSPRLMAEGTAFGPAKDVWNSAADKFAELQACGAETILILRLGPYVELDIEELLQFHRDEDACVTRGFDKQGPLDIWVLDPARAGDRPDLWNLCRDRDAAPYPVRGYVNRLETVRDVRRLVVDGLTSRCQFRPQGLEVRPGVWAAPGSQIDRGARIVAPAYIGRGAKIADQCLITRCSNIECEAQVDYGTAIEDSSVLAKTYVGIGLDLAHSIVDGNYLANLHRDVVLEIKDQVVLKRLREGKSRSDLDHQRVLADFDVGEMAISFTSE